jgi:transcriptional regulator with XRE-family HTH domain
MKTILKTAREQKNIKTRELAQLLGIDQALISKFENGSRKPTRDQITKLASVLEINYEELMIAWLKEKIYAEIGDDQLVFKAILQVQEEMSYYASFKRAPLSTKLEQILKEIDGLKKELIQFRKYDSFRISQALELEYTFESNKIEGNTFQEKVCVNILKQ